MSGIELVTEVPKSNVEFYKRCASYASFRLPLKVPSKNERYMDDGKHFTKSNVNVCYAAPRNKRKSRDWYETQLTVAKEITRLEGYPEKNVPFYIVTDDGYWFKAHTTSDGNKQFSAVGDELIMGRWLKGRLAAAGLVKPVNDTQADTEREGMITKEMLEEYGCDNLYLKKTGQKKAAAPILEKRHRKYFLRFSYTEDVLLTNAPVKEQIICSVDLELNMDTVYTIMRSDGTVLGRKFISVEKTPTSASGE